MKSFTLLLFASILFNTAFTQNTPLVGGVQTLTYKFKESSIRNPTNYEIIISEKTIEVIISKYTDIGEEKTTKSKALPKKEWAKLVDLSGKLQAAGNHYPDGGTGYKTYQLERKNGGAPEAYILEWTSLTEDQVEDSAKKLQAKMIQLAGSLLK